MKSSRHKGTRGKHPAKKSALEELDQIKKISKEAKSQKPISLSSFPFPEMATSALNGEGPIVEAASAEGAKKKKAVKKGKIFASPAEISAIINRVNEKEDQLIVKKRSKQEQYFNKEMQRQTSRLQKKGKKEERIQKGKDILKSTNSTPSTARTKTPSRKGGPSPKNKV